jgi:RecA-family ATPase
VKGLPGHSCQTIDAALQVITNLLAGPPANIYFCLSSQRLNSGKRSRKNAIAFQCVWVDIDVDPDDPKKYASLAEAIAAVFWFCDQLGIPRPSILVASGGGLHAYWLSDRTLSVDEWQLFADALKAAAKTANLKFDAGVTGDAARVLRVPGTINWKYDDGPRPVRLLQRYCNGTRHDFAAVFQKILAGNAGSPTKIADAFKQLDANKSLGDGVERTELPPQPFAPIKEGCAWLRHVHDTGGKDQSELLWRDSLRVGMSLIDGKKLIHEFSNKHPGYNFEATEEKYDLAYKAKVANDFGYPKCQTICDHGSGHCKSCPHLVAGGSPLHLALQQGPTSTLTVPPLPFINFANWDHEPIPEYEWSVLGRYPLRQTVLSTGEGAVGKSILKLQLAVAHVLGRDWLGIMPAPGPAIFVDAEDDASVLHIRLADILRHYGATFADAINGGLHLISLVGHDAVLGAPTRSGKIEPTVLYNQLLEAAGDIKPKMIGIASSADVFAGNEIDRSQVRQFVSLLTKIAIAANGTVSLIAHPSLTGINTGTGLSGNTAWHNSVRARDYMTSIKPPEDGEQPDTDLRQIIFKKNQYGPVAETIVLRYQDGLFLPEAGVGVDRAAREARADEVFIELLHRLRAENRYVSTSKSAIYAPAVFAKEDVAEKAGLKSTDFARAMPRLFAAKKIWNESYGKPSRPSYRIAPTTT